MSDALDLLIIGAGLSGIGAACRYVTECPDGRYAILEQRERMGGAWDLFRYAGIRSDSDMLTLGYDFRPWPGAKTLADGPSILKYIRDTAAEYGVDEQVQYNSRVTSLDFDTGEDLWTVTVEDGRSGESHTMRARFVLSCAGYYRYDRGHDPEFQGRDDFSGTIVHPQFWPEDLDYAGKRVAVIGSGATAVTLVPELAKTAAHVVQVQRTPSYVASIPSEDPIGKVTSRLLPQRQHYRFNRWKNIALSRFFYRRAIAKPAKARANIRRKQIEQLGPDYPVDTHFNPPYDPWTQRLCMVPDNDLFEAIAHGKASIVTGHIERFEAAGIRMVDGTLVEADIIVTATGLEVNFGGDAALSIDGQSVDIADTFGFKGLMFSGVPNLVSVFGYTNASWTLRADLMSRYAIRLIQHMDAHGYTRVTPVAPEGMEAGNWIEGFEAGYLMRVMDQLPKQGDRSPWLNIQDYKHDTRELLHASLETDGLVFSTADGAVMAEAAE